MQVQNPRLVVEVSNEPITLSALASERCRMSAEFDVRSGSRPSVSKSRSKLSYRSNLEKSGRSHSVDQAIANKGAVAVNRSKSTACIPIPRAPQISVMRDLVQNFFCCMNHIRRLNTRYKPLETNFLSMILIFAIRYWLN